MFFSFDGIDGVGKSTQIDLFCEWLDGQGYQTTSCRDPGSTRLGEVVREILLSREDIALASRTEMLLYMAARAQLVDELIRPALERGEVVVSDRFLLANVVYQGHAGGLDVETLWDVGRVATDSVEPDLTFLLDMPPEQAVRRMTGKPDRLEKRGDGYRERLRQGFLDEASRGADRIVVIDAARSIDSIAAEVRLAAERVLKNK